MATGDPVISIDTKKKELLGAFFRPGTAYTDGEVHVLDHAFATHGDGRLVPYGVFDVQRNEGLMLRAQGADTCQLACDAIWRWWRRLGRRRYGYAPRLLLLCDCGGSNRNRQQRFKEELCYLADDLQMDLQVAHYPPGCSKYNPIEHRMFCHITANWRGRPLTNYQVVIETIAATTTGAGLRIDAELDTGSYPLARVRRNSPRLEARNVG